MVAEYTVIDNDYSIRIYQSFVGIFPIMLACIMLNVFSDLLCSKQYGCPLSIYVTVSVKTLHVRMQILAYFSRFEIS